MKIMLHMFSTPANTHENESSARRLTAKANMRRVGPEAIIVIPIKHLFNFSENYNRVLGS